MPIAFSERFLNIAKNSASGFVPNRALQEWSDVHWPKL